VPAIFFRVFDVNCDGLLDRKEMATGFFVLAGGHQREKLKLIAEVFDDNQNGFLTKQELLGFYTLFFKFIHQNKGAGEISEMATSLADQTFAELGNKEALNYEEWALWQSRVR
jgi:Ca2+-binding EF-hand superfamily protein